MDDNRYDDSQIGYDNEFAEIIADNYTQAEADTGFYGNLVLVSALQAHELLRELGQL